MRTPAATRVLGALMFAAPFVGACATSPASVRPGSPPSTARSPATGRGAFIVRLGTDTMSVEQYVRSGNRLEGDILQRSPVTSVAHYVLTLNTDGTPQKLEYSARRPNGALLPNGVRSVTVYYRPDSVTTEIMRDTLAISRIAAREVFPYINNSFALFETWLGRLRAVGVDTTTVPLLGLGNQQPTGWPVRLVSRDSARVWYFGAPQYVAFDREGHIVSVDARTTTNKITVERVPTADVRALATVFAAREAAGHGFGTQASPRDTARATIGNATIWIDYGRPALRGRDVWQNGVLGDTIWRTGANAATQLNTSADLVANGVTIPAGMYTLWTHATAGGTYELIINKQTGQWGTVYDPGQDLVRLPLQVVEVPAPVERFTISIDGQGSGGAIRLAWGTKQLSLPFMVR